MSETVRYRHPQYFIQSLREYVLSPISTAARLVERERSEITAELEAFESFRDRLTSIDPVERTRTREASGRYMRHETTVEPMEQVRAAYRDTVMDTPHYHDVYREALVEHMAGEFGADVAEGVRADSSVAFTSPYKEALMTSTTGAVNRREAFVDTLNDEADSIDRARVVLSDILATLDTTVIPEWHCESFTERIDDIARRRQKALRRQSSIPPLDEYTLCGYLYQEEPWTFPVLTAITRTRESVELGEGVDEEHPDTSQR
ncbi:MAG: hypothetical protein ABEJ73_05940 [Haloplanus sp.]